MLDENAKLEPDSHLCGTGREFIEESVSNDRICVLELVSKQNSNKFRCSVHFSSDLQLHGEAIHSIDQLGLVAKQLHSDSIHPVDQLGLLLMQLVALMGIAPAFMRELEQLLERFPMNDNEEAV